MIHSIVPSEELFYDGWDQDIKPLHDITVGGMTMQVQPLADGNARIVRLISANPNDYLNPAYMPGTTLRFSAIFE